MMQTVGRWIRQHTTAIVAVVVTCVWMSALAAEHQWWLPVLFVGYVVVVPLMTILSRGRRDRRLIAHVPPEPQRNPPRASSDEVSNYPTSASTQPLEVLRKRYTRGELTDEQFESERGQVDKAQTREEACRSGRNHQ